jgi:predicted amidohydrolase YtcJ
LLLVFIALASTPTIAQDAADTIYSGGPILTINDASPNAEAVAVKDGLVVAVGSMADVSAHRGDQTQMFDLGGRAMLPGFVDSHGHVVMGGLQALSANLLAPPDGEVTDIASLQATLSKWAEDNAETVDKVQMIIGFGYDNPLSAKSKRGRGRIAFSGGKTITDRV